jgi:hypothetical protein
VHPKTGKVCVPIDPEAAWEFDPDTVCTVGGLLNQLNSGSAAAAQVGGALAGLSGAAWHCIRKLPCLASACSPAACTTPWRWFPAPSACAEPMQLLFSLYPPTHPPTHALQGEEPWRATDMSLAVDTFKACFLDSLQADVKAGLADKARQAAAEPTLAW